MSGLLSGNRIHLADEIAQSSLTVTTSQTEIFAGVSRNAKRQLVRIFNDGNNPCYIGPTGVSSAGSSKGEELLKKQSIEIVIGDVGLYAITSSSTTTLIVTELS